MPRTFLNDGCLFEKFIILLSERKYYPSIIWIIHGIGNA